MFTTAKLLCTVALAMLAGWFLHKTLPDRPNLAPEGVYFLMQTTSISHQYGVHGVPSGTAVTCLKDDGDEMSVTDGVMEFRVARHRLTNDLDLAARIQNADADRQARFQAERERHLAIVSRRLEAEGKERERREIERMRRANDRPVVSALNRGAYDQKSNVASAPRVYHVGASRYWVDINGRVHYVTY